MRIANNRQLVLKEYSDKLLAIRDYVEGKDIIQAAAKVGVDKVTVYRYIKGEGKKHLIAKKIYNALSPLAKN